MRHTKSDYLDALSELNKLEEKIGFQAFTIAILMREGLTMEQAESSYNAYIETDEQGLIDRAYPITPK